LKTLLLIGVINHVSQLNDVSSAVWWRYKPKLLYESTRPIYCVKAQGLLLR